MERKLLYLACLFVTSLLAANIIASKVVGIGDITFPAAVIVFPLTFLVTDTINEVWGKKTAREIVIVGFLMNIVLIIFIYLGQILPPAEIFEHQEAYEVILGAVPRITAASLLAYLLSQMHDIWAFNLWRKITGGKHLWLRNNLSTMTSQLIDSVVFISVAFWGIFALEELGMLILNQFLIKIIIAALDTPFCYLLVNWIRGKKEVKALE